MRPLAFPKLGSWSYFNPRTHVGCDATPLYCLDMVADFNPRTHVGCDALTFPTRIFSLHFNPRTHVGCDTFSVKPSSDAVDFNPRTHVGCDRAANALQQWLEHFNPRTHVGCDKYVGKYCSKGVFISIHAPTWGATAALTAQIEKLQFQSTHPRGVRPSVPSWESVMGDFNPRTHVGCDHIQIFVKIG